MELKDWVDTSQTLSHPKCPRNSTEVQAVALAKTTPKNHPEQPEQAAHTGLLQGDSLAPSKASKQEAGPESPSSSTDGFPILTSSSPPQLPPPLSVTQKAYRPDQSQIHL